MRLLQRGRRPRATTIRPAEPYLLAGTEVARRLNHDDVGTEHVLSVLVRDPDGPAARLLVRLGVSTEAVDGALAGWLEVRARAETIDPGALAALGIDLDTVRAHLERTFGTGALERTRSGCLGVSPRLKLALAYALDHAAEEPLRDEHVVLGLLSVPDSAAARVLAGLGITLADVQGAV
jgi:ATP-dependent Clp protease ATP-binding subunit ClpA